MRFMDLRCSEWIRSVLGVIWVFSSVCLEGQEAVATVHPVLVRSVQENGEERLLVDPIDADIRSTLPLGGAGHHAFIALQARHWPSGLVPVFERQSTRHPYQVRRRPPLGMEGHTEPLCFLYPNQERDPASEIAGRWRCEALHANGSKDFFYWDLSLGEEGIVGRFDQDTDYRFASIIEGGYRGGEFWIKVQYIGTFYRVEGELVGGILKGRWQGLDGEGEGTWEGHRGEVWRAPDSWGNPVGIYAWRTPEPSSPKFCYRIEGALGPEGWIRDSLPLARAWRVENVVEGLIPGR